MRAHLLFVTVVFVDEARVVVIVFLVLKIRLQHYTHIKPTQCIKKLTEATEVLWAVLGPLSRLQTNVGLGVGGHGMLTSEELSRYLGEALVEHVLVNEAVAVTRVRRHMLSTHHVSGSSYPVHSGETLVPEDIQVDFL